MVSGVVTTGIYCTGSCPATPLRRNVVEYTSTVAAEAAGFRPCLRCRPDRLPPMRAPDAAPPVVRTALLLINEGALDEATESDLGRRIGLSARQLRRSFLEHIGATPDLVARSRRAHFARRLLDETDLRISEIAFAAGFQSVRQMNRVVLDTFRFTPTELRAKRLERDRLVVDGGLPLRMPYTGTLSFDAMLGFLDVRTVPGLDAVRSGTYYRTISTHGYPGMIEVSDPCDGKQLLVLAHLPMFDSLIDDVTRARRVFGLDHPSADMIPQLRDDPLLRGAIAARPGLRPPGPWDRFETMVRIVVSQQISLRAARVILARLVRTFGTPVPGLRQVGLTHLFPSATRLASASVSRLASVGLTSARAASVRALAAAYANEELCLEPRANLDTLVADLQSLPGVGPWTAECIALRAVGHLDAFPADDVGLRRAASLLAGLDTRLMSAAELEERAEAWRPYRGLAATHLWAS